MKRWRSVAGAAGASALLAAAVVEHCLSQRATAQPPQGQAPNQQFFQPPPLGSAPSFPTAGQPAFSRPPGPPVGFGAPPIGPPPGDRMANAVPPRTAPAPPTVPPTKTLPGRNDFEGAEVVARVGSEVIQASDVVPAVNAYINSLMPADTKEIPPEEIEKIDAAFRTLMQQRIKSLVEAKLLVNDARRTIPPENYEKIEKSYGEMFDKDYLPKLLEAAKVNTREELEAKLRASGGSLALERRTYSDKRLAFEWLGRQAKEVGDVTHQDLVQYYREHSAEFDLTPEARWEQLSVQFENHNSKGEAYRLLATLGNDVLRGAPLAELAKARSEESAAKSGGVHDWTPKGSLASDPIDAALFSLPVGALSQIIEDQRGFHVVRVLERKEETRKSFANAQADIRKKIHDERRLKQRLSYIETLRKKTPVWTIFDGFAAPAVPNAPDQSSAARPGSPQVR